LPKNIVVKPSIRPDIRPDILYRIRPLSDIQPDIRYPAFGLAGYPAKTVSGAFLKITIQILLKRNYKPGYYILVRILELFLQPDVILKYDSVKLSI
jgi:hypothetical protein